MSPEDLSTKGDINSLSEKIDALSNKVERQSATTKQETYLRGNKVCEKYGISKSHLKDLRIEGKIPYTDAFDVLLYPQSLIEKVLIDTLKNNPQPNK